uniref:UPF0193 protein EVG1-like n=1 Tax=Pristiophorus japonicus TaxID=55135 RepID=UPI00398F5A72
MADSGSSEVGQQQPTLMMQESKLNQFQQRQLNRSLHGGKAFPVSCNPISSQISAPPPLPPASSLQVRPSSKPRLRPADRCRAGDAYQRERFRPRPTRNLEKEKQRLQNIMATGKDVPEANQKQKLRKEQDEAPEIDRFEELCNEIEERREFLEQMEAVGRGKDFRAIIHTEISQKIYEMEEIDKRRNSELGQQVEMDKRERGSTSS